MSISIYSTTTDVNSSKTVSFPVTVGGSNTHLLLLMSVYMNYPETMGITSMRYAGVDMTPITSIGLSSARVDTYIYSLANPTLGTNNITASFTWSIYSQGAKQMTVICLNGVNQITPLGANGTYYSASPPITNPGITLLTPLEKGLVVDVNSSWGTTPTVTQKSGQTLIYQGDNGCKQTVSTKEITTSSISTGYTIPSSPACIYDGECSTVINPNMPANRMKARNIRTNGRLNFTHAV